MLPPIAPARSPLAAMAKHVGLPGNDAAPCIIATSIPLLECLNALRHGWPSPPHHENCMFFMLIKVLTINQIDLDPVRHSP